jgi:moderate conductance mechanosensitive channel
MGELDLMIEGVVQAGADSARRPGKVLLILAVAVLIHFFVKGLRHASQWYLTTETGLGPNKEARFVRQYPKFATVTSLLVSALIFVSYFIALILMLDELTIDWRPLVATASVIGLAIGFGSQSLVQDVVMGLTLLFSDAFNVGDLVEVSGQIGRVERVGLRFTKLVNFHGQDIYVPNRNIAMVSRFRRGAIRAYADIQLPSEVEPAEVRAVVEQIALGMRAQYSAIILSDPRLFDWHKADPGQWLYMRVRFHLWPGQGGLIETTFRQRVVLALKHFDPNYADWMVTITYRIPVKK